MITESIVPGVEKLIKKYLEYFLAKGEIQNFNEFSDSVALTLEQAKEFVKFMRDQSQQGIPLLLEETNPNSCFFRNKDQEFFSVDYFVKNTMGIIKVSQETTACNTS